MYIVIKNIFSKLKYYNFYVNFILYIVNLFIIQ